jgi:hypothetical protein
MKAKELLNGLQVAIDEKFIDENDEMIIVGTNGFGNIFINNISFSRVLNAHSSSFRKENINIAAFDLEGSLKL